MEKESIYTYGGSSDVGYGREVNEDCMKFEVLDKDVLLAVIADGMGSKPSELQPAVVAIVEVVNTITSLYAADKEAFLSNPVMMMKEAVRVANRVIGAFKVSNEEMFSGFGVCITCCLIYDRDKFCFAHCGNTRLNLIRLTKDGATTIRQITRDFTKAMDLMEEGIITGDEYYGHPDRHRYTSGLGIFADPEIQTYNGKLKIGDLLLLTTDGIHYAIRQEAMADIVIQAGDWQAATLTLIEGAKIQKYVDNMTAMLVFLSK